MMDEHISEYNSFEAFCISVCSSLHTRAYPPSLGSSDLSQASLSFDLVVNPHELSYQGISSFPESIGPSIGFIHLLIQLLTSPSGHTGAYPLLREHWSFQQTFIHLLIQLLTPTSCILGHTLLSQDHRTFHRLHYLLTQLLILMSCHTGAYPLQPSLLASLSELSSGFRPLDQILVLLVSV